MRTYQENEKGEKQYIIRCHNFTCKYSPDGVIVAVWRKEYMNDEKCEKCGGILTETKDNWTPMP